MTIVDELQACLNTSPVDGTVSVLVPIDLLGRAINEIVHLRSLAGAVTEGPSHADLKRRQGPQGGFDVE